VRPDRLEVAVAQDGITGAVEHVRRDRQPAGVGQALADVVDVLGHTERLLHHDDAADGGLGGMVDRQRGLVAHASDASCRLGS
jgi:hypothetical protein